MQRPNLVDVVHPEAGTAQAPDDPGHLAVLAQSGWRRADQTAEGGDARPATTAKRRKAKPAPTTDAPEGATDPSPQED